MGPGAEDGGDHAVFKANIALGIVDAQRLVFHQRLAEDPLRLAEDVAHPVHVVDRAVKSDAAAALVIGEPALGPAGEYAAAIDLHVARLAHGTGFHLRLHGFELVEIAHHVADEELHLRLFRGRDGLLAVRRGAAEGLLAEDVLARRRCGLDEHEVGHGWRRDEDTIDIRTRGGLQAIGHDLRAILCGELFRRLLRAIRTDHNLEPAIRGHLGVYTPHATAPDDGDVHRRAHPGGCLLLSVCKHGSVGLQPSCVGNPDLNAGRIAHGIVNEE